jgi:hypothetical protein
MGNAAIEFVSELRAIPPQVTPQLAVRLREEVTRFPDSLGHWQHLLRVLRRLGRTQEAIACADEALKRFPENVELRILRIRSAVPIQGGVASAFGPRIFWAKYVLADARKLWKALPESPVAGRLLLDVLVAAEHWDEFETTARAMEWVGTDPQETLDIFAQRWIATGRLNELLACCDSVLMRIPAHTDAIYYRAMALALLGREGEACEAISLDRYLSISSLPVPNEYPNQEAFRDALVTEILADPTLMPNRNTTREGLQTAPLHLRRGSAVSALVDEIKIAVAAYVADLADGNGRFEMGAPKKAKFSSWAVVYGRNGQQTSHRHSHGWLSGVFYVSAPKLSSHNAYQGALKVGVLHESFASSVPWGIREVEPVPGRLVLFPSYTPHATEPSGIEGARICVAFDIIPAD